MLTLLQQDRRWITRDGREMALEDMTPEHRRNLQWMLRGRAERYRRWYLMREADAIAAAHGFDMPDGIFSYYSQVEYELNHGVDIEKAKRDVEETPLMKRLCELIADDLVQQHPK